jgi:orotate phosphoribosyltransferase
VAYAVAVALDVDFAWSTPPAYRMPSDDRRVAIVDDAINAGSAVAATARALSNVVAVGALLALGATPARIAGARVERLATLPSALWPAPACPLCAAGSPLDAPPS